MPYHSRTPHTFPLASRFMGDCTFAYLGTNSATFGAVGPTVVRSHTLGGPEPTYFIAAQAMDLVQGGVTIAGAFVTSAAST